MTIVQSHEEARSAAAAPDITSVIGQGPDEFVGGAWEKGWLLSPGLIPAQLCGEAFVTLLEGIFATRWVTPSVLRVVRDGKDLPASLFATQIRDGSLLVDRELVRSLLSQGSTVVFNRFDQYWPEAFKNCQILENFFERPVVATLFLTPADRRGLVPHYDGQDVVVHQMVGAKEWSLWQGPTRRATDCIPCPAYEDVPADQQIVLSERDVAYVPRGTVHRCVAAGVLSAHITYVIETVTFKDLALAALEHALDTADLRRAPPPGWATDGLAKKDRDQIVDQVRQASADLRIDSAVRELADNHYWSRRISSGGIHVLHRLPGGLREGDKVQLALADTARVAWRCLIWRPLRRAHRVRTAGR